MTSSKKTIYVLGHCLPMGTDPRTDWDIVRWTEHPALAPHALNKQIVSTASGDVELRIPPLANGNRELLVWAYQMIQRIHPQPEAPNVSAWTDRERLTETLRLALEYIALAEDGRGHNARSLYLAQLLRTIQTHVNQSSEAGE